MGNQKKLGCCLLILALLIIIPSVVYVFYIGFKASVIFGLLITIIFADMLLACGLQLYYSKDKKKERKKK